MKFNNLSKTKPKSGQLCLIKEFINGTQLNVFPQPQFYYDDTLFMAHPRVKEWAPIPKHVSVSAEGWKSEYRGDELPNKSCSCLVCTEDSKIVKYAYFSIFGQCFLGIKNVIAFMEI